VCHWSPTINRNAELALDEPVNFIKIVIADNAIAVDDSRQTHYERELASRKEILTRRRQERRNLVV
jgi:hypothetical protein